MPVLGVAVSKDRTKAKKGDKTLEMTGYLMNMNLTEHVFYTYCVCFVTEPTADKEKTKSPASAKKGKTFLLHMNKIRRNK